MITLFLLHPLKKIPVQHWIFDQEPVVRIGRSTDNHVVLYSAVVSRHHVELRREGSHWEIVNLGTNGTYVDGKRITQVTANDGVIIRLARSGPNVQIRLGAYEPHDLEHPVGSDIASSTTPAKASNALFKTAVLDEASQDVLPDVPTSTLVQRLPVPPHLRIDPLAIAAGERTLAEVSPPTAIGLLPHPGVVTRIPDRLPARVVEPGLPLAQQRLAGDCRHIRQGQTFCLDCGRPLHPLMAIADYQVVRVLGRGEVGMTYQVWQDGHLLVLKTLNQDWVDHPLAHRAFQQEVELLHGLAHPQIPKFLDYFQMQGQPYLAMEWMQGTSLEDYVQAYGAVSESQAAVWMIDLCGVLRYLHGQSPGVIHRNLNPQTILFQPEVNHPNRVVLVDFDIVETDVLQLERSRDRSLYVAPEDEQALPSPATDLYAIGALLIYLCTGQNPGLYYGNRDQGKRFYPDYIPGMSATLSRLIRQLTHPNPSHRYHDAGDLADDLQALVE